MARPAPVRRRKPLACVSTIKHQAVSDFTRRGMLETSNLRLMR